MLTIVTLFINLYRYNDNRCKSLQKYLDWGEYILKLPFNLIVYTDSSITYDFEGIKPALMRYTSYMWDRFTIDRLIANGALKQTYNEAIKIVPIDKMVRAYNEMVDLINSIVSYAPTIYHYIDTQYTGTDWDYIGYKKINSFDV